MIKSTHGFRFLRPGLAREWDVSLEGSGRLEVMVRERRRRCREKHRVSVRLTKILVYEVGQASVFTYPSV